MQTVFLNIRILFSSSRMLPNNESGLFRIHSYCIARNFGLPDTWLPAVASVNTLARPAIAEQRAHPIA